MDDQQLREVVLASLRDLSEAIGKKAGGDVVALFEPDAVMIGTSDRHVGSDEIALLVRNEVELTPETMTWRWDEQSLVVGAAPGVVWFVVTGEAVLTPPRPTAKGGDMAMRLSGVLRQQPDGTWRWAQFHGSTPAA